MSDSTEARYGRRWTTGSFCLTGVLAIVFTSASQGAPRKQNQAASNQELIEAVEVLQSVKFTLEKADHDYGGHRANAVKDIAQAEHQLLKALHAHYQSLGIKNPNLGKGKAMKEAQALSDAQLRQTLPVLANTITFLGKANHDYGGHRTKAIKDLEGAIKQLELALQYSAKHDQKKKVN